MAKLTFTSRITRDRDSGDFLSEVVEWDGDQEVNVVFVGWFDTHALALSAANEEATDYYTKQAASELADEAVYCEACGVAVNPAEAVLDGELMVCPGCAPCTVAEFAALVPDPETWQAVSEVPCEPVAPIGAVSSISRAELFDALCLSVDELRAYWADVPRRLKAINEAWEVVVLAEAFYFNAQGDLLVESASRPGTYYAVGHTCPCTAGRWGNHCRHSVVADILGRAVRIARLKAA